MFKMRDKMRKSDIYLLIYNNTLYVKEKDVSEEIKISDSFFCNGRINNFNEFIKVIKKSKLISKSSFKVVYDNINIIYFGDYTDLELNTLPYEKALDQDKRTYFKDIIDTDNNSYLFYNNGVYYAVIEKEKYILKKDMLDSIKTLTKSKIIMDMYSYHQLKKTGDLGHIYAVDNAPQFLLYKIC